MRLTVPQPELAEATRWIEKAMSSNPQYPVMMTMRFVAAGGRLTISGWDGDTALHATLDADIEHEGITLLPGKFLNGVIGALRKSDVTIECGKGRGVLTSPGVRVDIRPSDADEWPRLPKAPAVAGSIEGAEFIKAYQRIKAASVNSNENEVNEISGIGSVRLVASDGELQLAATDRYRVGFETVEWVPETDLGDAFAIIPARAIEKVAAFAGGRLTLALPANGTGTAGICGAGREVVTTLTAPSSFPKVDRAMPKSFICTARVDAPELLDAIRLASMVNTKHTRPVWLRFRDGSVHVSATDLDTAEVVIDAELDGDLAEFEIPFRGYFLVDALRQVDGRAEIHFSGASSPALITSAGGSSYRYVVLPIHDPAKASAAA